MKSRRHEVVVRLLEWAVASFALGACGGATTPQAATIPPSLVVESSPAAASSSPTAAAEDFDDDSIDVESSEGDTDDDEADGEEQLLVRIEDAPDVTPGTFLMEDDDVVFSMRLGARLVRARVDGFELGSAQSGNGWVFDMELATVAGGVVVVTHHNLDTDPPRFLRSRWSEGWWFPADMQSGEAAVPLAHLGAPYVHAAAQPDGSICFSDASGTAQRHEVRGRALVRVERPEPCLRIVAEQPEHVFVREDGHWEIENDDYLDIDHTETLGPGLDVVQVAWRDGEPDEEPREVRSTRLISWDEGPEGRVRWYYLAERSHCIPRRAGRVITCGSREFRLDGAGLIAID